MPSIARAKASCSRSLALIGRPSAQKAADRLSRIQCAGVSSRTALAMSSRLRTALSCPVWKARRSLLASPLIAYAGKKSSSDMPSRVRASCQLPHR